MAAIMLSWKSSSIFCFLLVAIAKFSTTNAFWTAPITRRHHRTEAPPSSRLPCPPLTQYDQIRPTSFQKASPNESDRDGGDGDGQGLLSNFNPLYASLWATFLTYGVALSPGQVGDPLDMQMIQSYIDNPAAPLGINPLFLIIFNGLGIMPLILAQLACPQGPSDRGAPAAPFLVASLAMGFGAAGGYLTFRGPPVERKAQDELSWFTRNVLENKVVTGVAIALLASGVVSAAGLIISGEASSSTSSTTTWGTAFAEYGALVQQSKFVSVSSLDLAILTVAAATLIPRDYQLRIVSDDGDISGGDDGDDSVLSLGRQIAVGTVFFPILGAALYCLWRPSLPQEEKSMRGE